MMEVRVAQVSDASSLLNLMHRLDTETQYMLLEPDERTTTVQEQQTVIESFIDSDSKAMFVAAEDNDIHGYIVGIGNTTRRNRHSAYCVIGVQQSSVGKGGGARLIQALEVWANQNGITRLELTVMCHNERAIRLYKSQSFSVEGTKKNSLLIDGQFVDEYYMAKLLD